MFLWQMLIRPGFYRIGIGARLGWPLATLLDCGHVIQAIEEGEMDSRCVCWLRIRVVDQGELVALLNELHGIGLPLCSLYYAGAADQEN